jgi:hypothetical protein
MEVEGGEQVVGEALKGPEPDDRGRDDHIVGPERTMDARTRPAVRSTVCLADRFRRIGPYHAPGKAEDRPSLLQDPSAGKQANDASQTTPHADGHV